MPGRDQQDNLRSVIITQSPENNSYSLDLPSRPDFFMCETRCDQEQLKPTLGSTRLYLGGGFKDETKSVGPTPYSWQHTDVAALESTQQEADTRVILHSIYSGQNEYVERIIIHSNDTAIVVICVYYASTLLTCRFAETVSGFAPHERAIYLPIHDIAAALGSATSRALPFVGKRSRWRRQKNGQTQINTFHLKNRYAPRELKIVWHGKLLAYSHKPVYLGVTVDRCLTYKDHIAKTKAKNGARNSILKKLANTNNYWGTDAKTIRTTALALYFSAAEYVSPVWSRSSHASKIDPVLNAACRAISGCLRPTRVDDLSISIVLILSTYECLLVFLVVLQVSLLRLIKYILSYLILYLLCGIAPPHIRRQSHPSLRNSNKKTTLCILYTSKIQPERG